MNRLVAVVGFIIALGPLLLARQAFTLDDDVRAGVMSAKQAPVLWEAVR